MNKTVELIRRELFALQDKKYADFQARLTPEKPRAAFIGVRTPELKALAKRLNKTLAKEQISEFLSALPHEYFEENNLHAFIASEIKDFHECVAELDRFLPYIDNWATCDQTVPPALKKNKNELLKYVSGWLKSNRVYTVRFAIGCFMRYYLGENFKPEYAELIANVKSDEYYVNMMQAWYFATALCKNQQQILPYFLNDSLNGAVLKKAIRKALESFRISDDIKSLLRERLKQL